MKKQVATKQFKSEIFREYSSTPKIEPLGKADNEMVLYMSDDNQEGFIEWVIDYEDGGQDVVDIGLWFTPHKELKDYDGVFSLCKQAIEFLEEQGFNCDYAKDNLNQI